MLNFKIIFNFFNFKKINLFRNMYYKKKKHFKYRTERLTIFSLNKIYFSELKKHVRVRKIFFYHINKNTTKLFIFNKPKSKLVRKKKK